MKRKIDQSVQAKVTIKISYLPMAAIVFEFGVEAQSPSENTFGYLTCCMVNLLTSTKPAALVRSFDSSNTCGTH